MARGLVEDYAFVCTPLDSVFTLAFKGRRYDQYISNPSQYNWQKVSVACVPENFLSVADIEFYYPQSLQDNVKTNSTVNGYRNAIEMLYSDDLVSQYPSRSTADPNNTDYYDIIVGQNPNESQKFTDTIKMLLPAGLESIISVDSGDIIRLRNFKNNADWTYRTDIRGMITKMPGFSFSGYATGVQLLGTPNGLVSDIQYGQMIADYASIFPDRMEYFYSQTSQYEWKDNLPKQKLFVKLKDGISAQERAFVANGVRAFFNDVFTQLLEKETLVDSLNQVN